MDYYCGVWKEIKKINIFIDALTKNNKQHQEN